MMILQLLSYKSGLYDYRLSSNMILWPFYPRDQFLGGSQPMVDGNWLKSIFFLFLDHLPGFPNYTFLNFQKKFFSLHPIDNTEQILGKTILLGVKREQNPP